MAYLVMASIVAILGRLAYLVAAPRKGRTLPVDRPVTVFGLLVALVAIVALASVAGGDQ